MTNKSEDDDSKLEEQKKKDFVSDRVKQYLLRAHSFQEVGTEQLPDEKYDVLHFPHLFLAAGVIMAVYGYYIIFISTAASAKLDGFAALIAGNIIATFGMIRLLKKYWGSFLVLLMISSGIIFLMMVIWDYLIFPWANAEGFVPSGTGTEGYFLERVFLVILTMTTFAYTACFVWFIVARYTSAFYFNIFSRGKGKGNRFFIVDPWRKTLKSKASLIGDIIGRIRYPFLLLLSILLSLSGAGELYFIQVDWNSYFDAVLLTYFLLCLMVVLFPAFWLLDYVRFYNESRLEVNSMGKRVLVLIYGYAGIGTLVSFISRSQAGFMEALLELYMLTLYLVPTLIVLIGGYVLLTERDVYYIAGKVKHGNKVIVEYRLIDSTGKELQWWIEPKTKQQGGKS